MSMDLFNLGAYKTQKTTKEFELSLIRSNIANLNSDIADLEQAKAEWVLYDEEYTDFSATSSVTNKTFLLGCESQGLTDYKLALDGGLDSWEKVACTNIFIE